MGQSLESGHGYQRQQHVLHNARVLEGSSDIRFGDLNVAPSLLGVIQQDPIAHDLRFSLGEVAPATKGNQWTTVTYAGRDQECEHDADEQSNETLD